VQFLVRLFPEQESVLQCWLNASTPPLSSWKGATHTQGYKNCPFANEAGRERGLQPNSLFSQKLYTYLYLNPWGLFSLKLKDGCYLSMSSLSPEDRENYLQVVYASKLHTW
jgi:hypothetical protein